MPSRFNLYALRWTWVAVVVLILDLWSKSWATTHLQLYRPFEVTSFFNLTLAQNTGAAFSFLHDAGGWQQWFFLATALVIVVFIFYWCLTQVLAIYTQVALMLIVGGAMGNAWDRFNLGFVVDFIDLHYRGWHWPAFNIADIGITLGAAILVGELIFSKGKPS